MALVIQFGALADELRLPAPSLAEDWDIHEFKSCFDEARGVLLAGAEEVALSPVEARLELHPIVGLAAVHLPDNPGVAVREAARDVEIMLRSKLGSLTGTLAQLADAFSTDPPREGGARLRFDSAPIDTDHGKNLHLGALHFAKGCALRVRNVHQHHEAEVSPSIALEQLAALSLLARWIDEARLEAVVEGPQPPCPSDG